MLKASFRLKGCVVICATLLLYIGEGAGLGSAYASEQVGLPTTEPSLAFTRWNGHVGTIMLAVEGTAGVQLTEVLSRNDLRTAPPIPFAKPTFFPDGEALAYAGFRGDQKREIFSVAINGSGLRRIRGTQGGSLPVLSPNGRMLAFTRSRLRLSFAKFPHVVQSTSIWLLNVISHHEQQITPWRGGTNMVPTSFSPDGQLLAASKEALNGEQVILIDLQGKALKVIANNANEAVFSPDGSEIAFVKHWDAPLPLAEGKRQNFSTIYVAQSDGAGRRALLPEERNASSPAWDSSGERLAFVVTTSVGRRPSVVATDLSEVNADGTCVVKLHSFGPWVKSIASNITGPVWQPATSGGRISCG